MHLLLLDVIYATYDTGTCHVALCMLRAMGCMYNVYACVYAISYTRAHYYSIVVPPHIHTVSFNYVCVAAYLDI